MSVWYRFVLRICCLRVVGVHMATPGLVSATPWNHVDSSHSTHFRNGLLVIDLEGLLSVLEHLDASWRDDFLHLWGKLEDERAFALFNNEKVIDQETTERIIPVVSKLKL